MTPRTPSQPADATNSPSPSPYPGDNPDMPPVAAYRSKPQEAMLLVPVKVLRDLFSCLVDSSHDATCRWYGSDLVEATKALLPTNQP